MKELRATELGWLAGLLEGEGCFGFHIHSPRSVKFFVRVGMTDEDVVRRIQQVLDVGTLRHADPAPGGRGNKRVFYWTAHRKADAVGVMQLVYPLMGERRQERIRHCLELEESTREARTKTHCVHGHPFDDANTYDRPDGRRGCRRCRTEAVRRWRVREE